MITSSNYGVIKCYRVVFSKVLKKNLGSYLLIFNLVAQLITFILYLTQKNNIYNRYLGQPIEMNTLQSDSKVKSLFFDSSKKLFPTKTSFGIGGDGTLTSRATNELDKLGLTDAVVLDKRSLNCYTLKELNNFILYMSHLSILH